MTEEKINKKKEEIKERRFAFKIGYLGHNYNVK